MAINLIKDIKAVKKNDPSAKNIIETLLSHAPLHAIMMYRFYHVLNNMRIPVIPRFLSMINRFMTGIEIHPGAKIGEGFFIDHGMGIVVGETAEVGDNCVLFHNVTLGGTGHHEDKRHPTLGNNVLVGTGSVILGPVFVGNNVNVGAKTVIINRDVPSYCTVVGTPGRIIKLEGEKVDLSLPLAHYKHKD
jgi:serine O-acetyltransferase